MLTDLASPFTDFAADAFDDAIAEVTRGSNPVVKPRGFPEYKGRYNEFIVEILGDEPWGLDAPDGKPYGQALIGALLPHHRLIGIAGCKGYGKTYYLARIALAFLLANPDALIIVTATKWSQVEDQFFAELRTAHAESDTPLPGEPLRTRYELAPKWSCIGISPRHKEGGQGYHARASKDGSTPVLVIADEAGGIDDGRLDSLRGLLTNLGSKMIWSGNLTREAGRLTELFRPPMGGDAPVIPGHAGALEVDLPEITLNKDGWALLRVTAYDAPSWIIDPAQIEWYEKSCAPEPEKHPLFRSDILALPPLRGENSLFPLSLLDQMTDVQPLIGGRHMGVDVAGLGGDRVVALLLVNGRVTSVKVWNQKGQPKDDEMRTAQIIRNLALGDTWMGGDNKGWDVLPRNVHVDSTGLGSPIVSRLWQMNVPVDGVQWGESGKTEIEEPYWRTVLGNMPDPKVAFGGAGGRKRQLFWLAWRLLHEGLLAIPRHESVMPLWTELVRIEGGWGKNHKFWVMDKDAYKAEYGESHDFTDALVCALSRTNAAAVRFSKMGGKPAKAARKRRVRPSRRHRR